MFLSGFYSFYSGDADDPCPPNGKVGEDPCPPNGKVSEDPRPPNGTVGEDPRGKIGVRDLGGVIDPDP